VNALTFGAWDQQRKRQKRQKEEQLAKEAEKNRGQQPWWKRTLGATKKSNSNLDSNDPEDFVIEYYDDPNLLQNRPWTERAVVISMGVVFNLILSFSIYFGAIGPIGNGLPQPVFDSGVIVTQAPIRDGPSVGLLQQGDIITGINGKQIILTFWKSGFCVVL
jgi:hypothetical protein